MSLPPPTVVRQNTRFLKLFCPLVAYSLLLVIPDEFLIRLVHSWLLSVTAALGWAFSSAESNRPDCWRRSPARGSGPPPGPSHHLPSETILPNHQECWAKPGSISSLS